MNTPHFVEGNHITLLHNGKEYFPMLEAAINAAQQEIHLETYIFESDAIGIRIAEALKSAAQRGVTVRLLFDGFGSQHLPKEIIQNMLNAGIQILIYRQEFLFSRPRRYRLRRMHRKLVVIDACVAFIGGINIIDDLHNPERLTPRFDFAIQIKGPLLSSIYAATKHLWKLVAWAHLKKRWRDRLPLQPIEKVCGNQLAALVIRDNLRHRHDIEHAYLQAINQAQHEIIIANAYFLPGKNFRDALNTAAQRGVNVILLLQGRIEYILQYHATRALYGSLLDAGIKIYEYTKSYLHAKVAVIDQHWATVGSSNIDPFSLLLAREANVIIDDQPFATELRSSLMQAITDESAPVLRAYWKEQSWFNHALNAISYHLVRLLQGIVGYNWEENRSLQ